MSDLAAWGTVIAAIVGPIVSVAMAHQMQQHASKRQEASLVFRKLMEDVQNFRHAFLDVHRYSTDINTYPNKLNALLETISLTTNATDAQGKQLHTQAKSLYDYGIADQQAIQERYSRAFRELRSIEALLNADKLALGLLFDNKSEACGRLVNDLLAMPEIFTRETIPSFIDCQNRLLELIQNISREIKPLFNSLNEMGSMINGCPD